MKPLHVVRHISPMLAVGDMKETLSFYKEVLGFKAYVETDEYSIIERDGFPIHLMKAANSSVMDAVRGHAQVYIEVSDIRSLWDHVSGYRERYKIRDLFTRDYGMTEFHIGDPNDCLIFVGERTANLAQSA